MEDVIALVERVGFPIVVALFVLVRLNGKFDKLRESIEKLIRSLDRHTADRERD